MSEYRIEPLTAVCGSNCAKCPAYAATQTGDRATMEKMAADWTKALGKPFSAEDIACDGCRTNGRRCGYCGICEIRACAVAKAHETCAHCAETACERLTGAPEEVKTNLAELRAKLGRS